MVTTNTTIKSFVVKIDPQRYYEMIKDVENDPEKAKFYFGLFIGAARPSVDNPYINKTSNPYIRKSNA